MKTRKFIPTLLACAIRVMVAGQTQENQSQYRALSVLGVDAARTKTEENTQVQQQTKHKKGVVKVYPTVVSDETDVSKKNKIDNNTFNYYNDPGCYSTLLYAQQLSKQAEELLQAEEVLKKVASVSNGEEKEKYKQIAINLQAQAQLKQIQSLEITGRVNLQSFNTNQFTYKDLLIKIKDEDIANRAESLDAEACFSLKQAKEMREEAYSQRSDGAKLGNLSNAADKESEALTLQDNAITLLRRSLASHISLNLTGLAVK